MFLNQTAKIFLQKSIQITSIQNFFHFKKIIAKQPPGKFQKKTQKFKKKKIKIFKNEINIKNQFNSI
jgi:hypothetical protein